MFIPILATLISILVIMSYLATSGPTINYNNIKMTYEKVKYIYTIEEVLVNATENLCQKNSAYCKSKEVGGVISLNALDLAPYLPDNFVNSNLNEGSFGSILIKKNYTTIQLTHNISDENARYIYLNHYKGKEYGIQPQCVVGSSASVPVCDSIDVYHDYPTSLNLRAALE